MKYAEAIVEAAEESAARVATAVKQGRAVIALGGDHSLSLGTISGASVALGGDLGVIWIDAHGDINTDATTVSGNIHGMPLAGVLGMGHKSLTSILEPGQKVQPKNVVYAGLKDLDQAEIDTIRAHKIPTTTAMDIARHGLEPLFKNIVALQKRVKRIWVSLDVDSIDAEYAPGTPMVNRGGLTYREIAAITSFIGKTCRLAGFDIVELAPRHDKAGKTAKLAVELSARLLGGDYSWYTEYMNQSTLKKSRATK
jgi:arginase